MLSLSMFPERWSSSDISNSKRKPPVDFAQKKGQTPCHMWSLHKHSTTDRGSDLLLGQGPPVAKAFANARQNRGIPSMTKPSINLLTKADAVTHHSMDYSKKNHGRPTVIGTTGITGHVGQASCPMALTFR